MRNKESYYTRPVLYNSSLIAGVVDQRLVAPLYTSIAASLQGSHAWAKRICEDSDQSSAIAPFYIATLRTALPFVVN